MTVADVNGLSVHHRVLPAAPEAATGESLVCLHGLGTDSLASFYLTLAPPLAAAGIDVVTYDLRGHGRTERPHSGYTVGHFVDDLAGLLAHLGLGEQRVHLVGNSFGGTVAFGFAHRFPERVGSIVSIEAEPATQDWANRMAEVLGNTVDFLHDEKNYGWITEHYSAHHSRLARAAADRITATTMVEEIPVGPLVDADDLSALTMPVLSLLGDDGYQSRDPEALIRLLPDARLVLFPQQGHSVLVERHREVRELVRDWVLEHRTAGAVSRDAPWPGC